MGIRPHRDYRYAGVGPKESVLQESLRKGELMNSRVRLLIADSHHCQTPPVSPGHNVDAELSILTVAGFNQSRQSTAYNIARGQKSLYFGESDSLSTISALRAALAKRSRVTHRNEE